MNFFKKYLHVFIATVIAALICGGVMVFESQAWGGILPAIRLWCDGTFISGVFLLGFGGLSYISQNGGFDAIRYAFAKLKDRFVHPKPDDRADQETYYDYVKSRRSNKKKPVLYLIIIGAVLIIISIILAIYTPDIPLYTEAA